MNKLIALSLKSLGLIILTLTFSYIAFTWASNQSLQKAYAELNEEGRPLEIDKVTPVAIPDSENAALVYEAVALKLRAEPAGEQNLFSKLVDLADRILAPLPDSPAKEEFRQLCLTQAVSETLAELQKATEKKGCGYDLDYSKGPELMLPHLRNLIGLTKILCAEARFRATDGDHTAAWDSALISLHLANALKEEPIFLSQLTRLNQFFRTADTLQVLIKHSHPTDQQYEQIVSLLKDFEDTNLLTPLIATIDMERLSVGEWVFSRSYSEYTAEGFFSGNALQWIASLRPFRHLDHTAYLRIMHACTNNAGAPYLSSDTELMGQLMKELPWYCLITQACISDIPSIKLMYLDGTAQARVTRAGLTVLRYQQKNRLYPDDLNALNLSDIEDPFTGKELVYRVTSTGFVIYSIGMNLIDDHGILSQQRNSGDIVWHYSEESEIQFGNE